MEQFYCKYSKIIFLQSILHYLKVVVRINFYLTVFFSNIFWPFMHCNKWGKNQNCASLENLNKLEPHFAFLTMAISM